MNTKNRPSYLPVRAWFSRVSSMVILGLPDTKIAALLRIQLTTLKRFFSRALEFRTVPQPRPANPNAKPKETYRTEPPPPGSIIICGRNGEEIVTS